jgi:hypothetical protein
LGSHYTWRKSAPSTLAQRCCAVSVGRRAGSVENFATDTYRAVYTVRFRDRYVLHCFKEISKGIETPGRMWS